MNLYGLLDAIIGKVNRSVKVDTQELGETLQKQARNNIGAVGKEEICNPNLLDNWYFLNPINQRGQNEYNSSWPSIDRWNTACKIIINEEGLLASSETENWGIQQELSFELFQGENFTGSIFLTEVTGTVTLILQEAGGNWITPLYYDISAPGVHSISTIIPSGGQLNKFNFGLLIKSGSAQIKAIKFERGNTQTLAHQDSNNNWVLNEIPKYEEELLKCRQYDPYTGKYIGLRKFSQSRNLLDNSDFRKPVNQKGFVSGNVVTAWATFIDRWQLWEPDNAPTLTAEGLYTSSGIKQTLSGLEYLVGKKVTAACGFADGTTLVVSGTVTNVDSWTVNAGNGYGGAHIEFTNHAIGGWQLIILNFPAALQWAALYEGEYTIDTLPEYQSKGYAEELAICTQYNPLTEVYKGDYSIDLLWENASPSSAFAEQTIALDLSKYDSVKIAISQASSVEVGVGKFCRVPVFSGLSETQASLACFYQRIIEATSTSILFYNCIYKVDNETGTCHIDNTYLIPYKIYGIKGVG